jgi:AcrR family transcriptional regulator
MSKGKDTKLEILEKGLDMASQVGLEAISIGSLAKAMKMSKSGLFAHFNAKENLQIEILGYAARLFADKVIRPSLQVKRGISRIRALVENWINWSSKLSGGCIFVSASIDFSERVGNVRNHLLLQQEQWIDTLRRIGQSAVKAGEFQTDSDCDQFAYDLYSLLLGFHYYDRLLQNPKISQHNEKAIEQLLRTYSKSNL